MGKRSRKRNFRRQRFTERAYTPYVLAIGQLALAWNDLHEQLAGLFCKILDRQEGYTQNEGEDDETYFIRTTLEDQDDPRPIALWNSAKFDRPRREMLKAAVSTINKEWQQAFPKFIPEMTWVLQRTDALEDSRNDAVHSPLMLIGNLLVGAMSDKGHSVSMIMPSLLQSNPRAQKLLQKELLPEYRWCRDASLTLRDYVMDITISMQFGTALTPWPDRPSLPNRGQKRKPQAARRHPPKE
jgi:hypothetical protein